jgi:Fe-S cluster assembly ATP-binding protein
VNALRVSELEVRLGDLRILRAINLEVPFGELHVLMGPNGSGKSTLCHALMGRPGYEVTGVAEVGGVDLLSRDIDGRAAAGLFEVFQYPVEIPGVTLGDLLAEMAAAGGTDVAARAAAALAQLETAGFVVRAVNGGLSGGEKEAIRDDPAARPGTAHGDPRRARLGSRRRCGS